MHSAELARLKDEHSCILTRMLEQHQKEIAILKMNTNDNQEVATSENIMKER